MKICNIGGGINSRETEKENDWRKVFRNCPKMTSIQIGKSVEGGAALVSGQDSEIRSVML